MLNIAVLGAGRMAREIIAVVGETADCQVGSVWARDDADYSGIPVNHQLSEVLSNADVAVDFTLASATSEILQQTVDTGTALVCGVSGLAKEQMQQLDIAATQIPLLYDRNMSMGIAAFVGVLQQLGPALSVGFSTEVHETHHCHKIDAPSGTALMLGETLAESREQRFEDVYHYDPDGDAEPDQRAIRFLVSREGEVPGDHSVVFRSATETVTITHSVADRRVFAEGAVMAARWLAGQPAGRYRMIDLLNR